ncbi:MAG: class I SAM-dependent methyltransferase [Bdellovibrionales bacterium]|nr:class I SAM-dependent methyltransferase [Bdellovibrionales bacterium]
MRNQISKEQSLLHQWAPKPEPILEIENRLKIDHRLGINIDSMEGLFLRALCLQPHVEKVVEIGTQYGCSTTWMAMGLKSKGIIYTCEQDEKCIAAAKKTFTQSSFLETGCRVELLEGPALESLPKISAKGPFDLIFIDANKSGYLDYYHWAKDHLKSGGYLIADNVFLFGHMFHPDRVDAKHEKMLKVMQDFYQALFSNPEFCTSMIPTAEGMLFAVKS